MKDNEYSNRNLVGDFKLLQFGQVKILPYVLLSLTFFALMVPLILKPGMDIYDARDEADFHYPAILAFIDQFPHLDLANYHLPSTPLYHIVLTFSAFIFGSGIIQLRFINSVISLACLLVVYGYLSKRGEMLKGLFFAIIFMLSPYFIGPTITLSTDNMALLLAILSILTMDIGSSSAASPLLTNILILFTILTRQIYAWLIGAYFAFNFQRHKGKPGVQRITNLAKNMLLTVIPVIGIFPFLFSWKGLTPPHFAVHTALILNWDAPIYVVSLLGLYGSFFCFWYLKLYRRNQGRIIFVILLIASSVGGLLLHPVSNEYDRNMRGGALWLVASQLPNLFSSSIVYWVLFPIGLLCLYVMTQHLASKREYVMIISFLLWLITNVVNSRTYQKYYEPFILFFIGYTLMPLRTEKWYHWIGPIVLLVGFIGITLVRFF